MLGPNTKIRTTGLILDSPNSRYEILHGIQDKLQLEFYCIYFLRRRRFGLLIKMIVFLLDYAMSQSIENMHIREERSSHWVGATAIEVQTAKAFATPEYFEHVPMVLG